jgi:hypothetical protein
MKAFWFLLGLVSSAHLLVQAVLGSSHEDVPVLRYLLLITAAAAVPLVITWRRDIRENPVTVAALLLTAAFVLNTTVFSEAWVKAFFVVTDSDVSSGAVCGWTNTVSVLSLVLCKPVYASSRATLAKWLRLTAPEPLS